MLARAKRRAQGHSDERDTHRELIGVGLYPHPPTAPSCPPPLPATPHPPTALYSSRSGLVCCAVAGERLDELRLPLMVTANTESHKTAFTHSVDFLHGTRAEDRESSTNKPSKR